MKNNIVNINSRDMDFYWMLHKFVDEKNEIKHRYRDIREVVGVSIDAWEYRLNRLRKAGLVGKGKKRAVILPLQPDKE